MKKIMLMIVSFAVVFAFELNHSYNCQTLGISFKNNNKTYNIPNNEKTQEQLKKSLKLFYSINVNFKNKNLVVQIGDQNDTLVFVKNVKDQVSLYVEKEGKLYILADANASQIGLSMPSQDNLIIYYQCK
jgi:hypothetical protein